MRISSPLRREYLIAHQNILIQIEWENAAAIPITNFSHWWKECTEYSIRKAVNRAKKLGVTVTSGGIQR